jgi:hypothetical protein
MSDNIPPEIVLDQAMKKLRRDLALSVLGPDMPNHARESVGLETLIWKAGAHRRQIEDAHNALDTLGVPRESDGGTLTLVGRIKKLTGFDLLGA